MPDPARRAPGARRRERRAALSQGSVRDRRTPGGRRATPAPRTSRRRSARARRTSGWPVRLAVTFVALLVTAVVIGLLGGDDGGEAPQRAGSTPAPSATARAEVDYSALPIARAPFCDVLDEEGVTRALDGPVTGTAHYGNGDEAEIAPGYTDVSHEFNCTFEGTDGASARVWLFARPVEQREAAALVRRGRRLPGCTFPTSVAFGRPALISVCEAASPAQAARAGRTTVTARMQGLFGDSWLSCEVTAPAVPAAEVRSRARAWCTDVVTSLGARP